MTVTAGKTIRASLLLVATLASIAPSPASAHCDTMDGPVITAARQALRSGDVDLVLVWVQAADETKVREEFERARTSSRAGGAAQEAAERRFFEELVRVHREGEGAPYTGVKPAGTPIDPGVLAADRSLESGSSEEVQQLLTGAVQTGLQRTFRPALELRDYDSGDVAAGREYVAAYVVYTHFVEGALQALAGSAHHGEAGGEHGESSGHETGHAAAHLGPDGHGGHASHLPWILVAVLGLGLIGETAFIVIGRRSRPTLPPPGGPAVAAGAEAAGVGREIAYASVRCWRPWVFRRSSRTS